MRRWFACGIVICLPFLAWAAAGPLTEIDIRVTAPGVINTIQLCSTSGSTIRANAPSPPMFSLAFKKGDISAGQYPRLQAADGTAWPATFINVRHWSDGSLKIVGVLPGPFPKDIPTNCVNANVMNGGTAPAPSGLTPAQLYSEQIALNADGFPGDLGTAFGLTDNWQAKLNADNVEVVNYGDGPGGRVYRVLTHVAQNGAPHGQMEVYWYIQQLLNANGGLAGYRVLPRLTQPWYNQDVPAKDRRVLKTLSIQAGATIITAPFPYQNVHLPASGYRGTFHAAPGATDSWFTCGHDTCYLTGYLTTTGTLPTGLAANTLYCGRVNIYDRTQLDISNCPYYPGANPSDAGTGTHTFHPVQVLNHFGTLWGARSDGRYSYIQASGTAVSDAPILVKGKKVYDQATRLFPPWDLTLDINPNPNGATYQFGEKLAWDTMTTGPLLQIPADTGGERDEIGLRNAWCARWFYNRTVDDDKYVRILGLVSGLYGNAVRDVTTKGPIHLGDPAKSYAGMPSSSATSFGWHQFLRAGFTPPAHGGPALFADATDDSHMPDLAGCAYLATGEPQYLDMQMEWANHSVFSRDLAERNGTVGGVNYFGVVTYKSGWGFRQMAWGLRPIVDADAWWPDTDPAGTQVKAYLHDLETASMALPRLFINNEENAWGKTNCYWAPAGTATPPWMRNYFNTVAASAYNSDEDPNGLDFLNCSATWYQHYLAAFGNAFLLFGGGEQAYDTGALGSAGSLEFTDATFTWSDGIATLAVDNAHSGGLFTGETITVSAAGYPNPPATFTLTRVDATHATFPLASNPGAGPIPGTFEAIGKLISSDAGFTGGPVPPVGLNTVAWQAGTPGSFAVQWSNVDAPAGSNAWSPANGDKYIFMPYTPTLAGTAPGGLLTSAPYYVVNEHAGTNCAMSWAAGLLTVKTCAPHGITGTVLIGVNSTDAPGLNATAAGLLHCTVTDTTHFTCPVASDPVIGTKFGNYNSGNLAASPGGTALAITDTGSITLTQSPRGNFGVIPANPPPTYWVDYPFYAGYLAVARNAANQMAASGVTGLDAYLADIETRFAAMLAFDKVTKGGLFKPSSKYATQRCFGSC